MKIENIKILFRNNFKSLNSFIIMFIKPYFWQILLCTVFLTICSLSFGMICNIVLDGVTNSVTQSLNSWKFPCFLLGLVYLVGEVSNYAGKMICLTITPKIEQSIRLSALEYMESLSMSFFSNNSAGKIESINKNLSEGIKGFLDIVIMRIIPSVLFILICLAYLFAVNFKIGLMFFIGAILYSIIFYFLIDRFTKAGKQSADAGNERNGAIIELFSNIKLTKIMNLYDYIFKKMTKTTNKERFYLTKYYVEFNNLSFALGLWLNFLSLGLIVLSFIYNPSDTGIKMINIFFAITYRLWQISQEVINIVYNLLRADHARNEIYLIKKNESLMATKIISQSNIEVKNLSISFKNNEVIKDFSISIPRGSKFCLIGCSGVGKSTFLNAIAKLIEIENNQIFIDNHDLNSISLESFKSKISYISQTNYMFNGSILENISIGKANSTMEEVIEICKKVKIHDFISTLPEGYNTSVNSFTLSGGQIQRICIARALLNCGDIVICDEPVSALDFVNGKEVVNNILELTSDKTVLWVDHFSNIAKILKNVIFFDSKRQIHVDTHENLFKNHPEYPNFFH